jgi:hypothetical protein
MTTNTACTASPVRSAPTLRRGLRPWLKLVAAFALIWACIFALGALLSLVPGAAHMAEVIDERNIRATAIYYTDLEESFEGSEYIRHSLESMPVKE